MKIAIHHREGGFSDRWIEYCKVKGINYKVVDAFDSNIINLLTDCDILMWHHHHAHYKDVLTAKRILFALEHAGIKVFPDFKTGWHFDDKVAQKYLLEAIDAPLVPSYVFYDKKQALKWAEETDYPKVFKLKGGAGASNVKLVQSFTDTTNLINQAFGRGFSQFDRIGYLKERFNKFKKGQDTFIGVLKGLFRVFIIPEFAKQQPEEKGYIYFQEFIPNNKTDYRIKVINDKCWGFQRKVRDNDFRASGSGNLIFDVGSIPLEMVKISLEIARKLQLQSVAFDFVIDENNKPLIVEISYGFGIDDNEFNYGYWDSNLKWNNNKFDPRDWILLNLVNDMNVYEN